jgi:hypothetical protein
MKIITYIILASFLVLATQVLEGRPLNPEVTSEN